MRTRWILFLLILLTGCQALDKFQNRLAWASYPGASVYGQCEPYARAVTKSLRDRNIEAYYVAYDWTYGKDHGAHAVCVFHTALDLWFIVDNEGAFPTLITNTPLPVIDMIHQVHPAVTSVRKTEPKLP